MYKQHLKNAMSIMLSVAMLTSSMFSNVVNVSAVTDDGITVETATSDDGITVESETNNDGIEIETVHLDSSVAVKDDGITVDGAIPSGSKIPLTVTAKNNLSEVAKFRLYFANAVDNQQLPEDKTQWNDMIKNVPEKLSAIANQVIVTDSNGNETEVKATFMQDKDGDIATASYVEVEVSANSTLHLDVDVSNDDAGKVFAIPYLKAASEDAYGKAVDISWQKDDSIQIEEDTSKDNTNASDDNGIIVDDATSEDGIQIEENTDTKGIITDDKDSDKSDDTSKDTSDAEDVNGVIFDQTGADDSTGQTAEERAEEENARTVDGETEAEVEENENSDIIRYIPSTGESIDEKAELEADEKAFEENAPPQKEGYPQADSYVSSVEAVAQKDIYFEAKDYNKYKDVNLEVESADDFNPKTWQADDKFTIVYKLTLKDDDSYSWHQSVDYIVVDNATKATIKSEECDRILPDWVPTEGGVGVPELAETVLTGKNYTVHVNDKNWYLDVAANGYDMGRFRSVVEDDGNFDITKVGTYTVRYKLTYFMAPDYPWYVDTTINVVDDKTEGSQIKLLNDSLKVLMDDELIEYGQEYTTDKTEVTFTVQAQNANTFDAIKPVVKVLKGEDEISDAITKTDEKDGVYTYVVKLSGKETVTIDDTANTCIFSNGKGYGGGWQNVADTDLTKDDVDEAEQVLGNVNVSDTEEINNDIATYAINTTSKNFGAIGTGDRWSSKASIVYGVGGTINGVYVKLTSAGQTSIYNWVKGLKNTYDAAGLRDFKSWLSSVKIDATCKTHGAAGWYSENDYKWYISADAEYNTSTKKLTVTLTAKGNEAVTDNYQFLKGLESHTDDAANGKITIKKRLINQDWSLRWHRVSMNAQFVLKNSRRKEIKSVSLKDADATSKTAVFSNLPFGTYYLQETYACNGCIINDTEYKISLSNSNPSWTPKDNAGDPLITGDYITNQTYYYCGVILKKVETSTGTETPLPGAVFKIEYKPSSTSAAEATWYCRTGSEGEVWLKSPYILPSWNGISSDEAPLNNAGDPCLPIGVVTIQEVKAPSGYSIGDSSVKTIFLRAPDSGRVIDYNIPVYSNTPSTWDVNVRARKLDATDGSPLSGAVIGIYSDSNCTNELARYTTGSDGYTDTYTYSALGSQSSVTLWCQEISAPSGYVRNYTKYSLTFSKSEKGQTKTFGTNVSGNTGIPNYPEDWHVWIRTKKVDATDGSPLSDAVFGVYYNSSCSGSPFTTLTSRSNGYTETYRLDFEYDETGGTYYCQEISAPYGYQRNARIYPLTITKSDKGDTLTFGESTLGGTAVPDYPEGWNVSVRAMKVDAADGTPLSGATFGLWRNSSCSGSPFTTLTSRSNGYTETYDFSYDYDESGETIYCQEMSAPAGYHTNTKIYPLTLSKADDGQTLTFGESTNGKTAIPDTKKVGWKASFNTRKLDAETGAGLANAEFTVYSDAACTDVITVLKSGSDGWTNTYEMTFDYDDDSVTVYCVETKAPSGYERDEGIYKLTFVKANDAGKTKTFGGTGIYDNRLKEEWLLRYRVKKVDANGNPLANAIFNVYDDAGCTNRVDRLITGSDGYTSIGKIESISEDVKSYKLYCREVQAPTGYVVDKTVYSLTWTYEKYKALKSGGDDSGELQMFGGDTGIVNVKDFWKLRYRIKKVDANGKALENAVFRVYDNENCDGTPVAELTTGKDGYTAIQTVDQIQVTSTSYKLYCKEYSAPDGYAVSKTVYPLTWSYDSYKALKDKGDETGELQTFGGDTGISNAKDYWKLRYRVKKVNAEGNALAGAIFRIYNDENCSGTPVAEITTGKDGFTPVQTIENIWTMTKSYKLYCKEYKAPAGYVVSKTIYPLTWSYDSYKALKVKGDTSGELQTFGGDAGIANVKDFWRLRYRVKKVDADGKALENAVFHIYDNENCNGDPVAEITTGKDGYTAIQTVDQIPVTSTSYKLYCKEYSAPDGYTVNTKVYPLTWSYDTYKTAKDKGDETGELQTFGGNTGISNAKDYWKLRYRVKKVDAEGNALAGAVFRIYNNENCSGTPVAELTTGKDGLTPVQTVENIWTMTKSYKLYCKEYKAPAGYAGSTDVYPLTWSYDSYKALKDKGNETGELQTFGGDAGIVNMKDLWRIRYRIKKVDEDGKALENAVFRIYDNENCDGTPVAELTTGKDGFTPVQTVDQISVTVTSYKLYCKEYKAPDGYVVDKTIYPLTWSYDSYKALKDKGDETGELQTFGGDTGVTNTKDVWKLRYRIKKVDEDGKALENAVFRVYDNENCDGNPVAELTTGKDGFTPVQTVENIWTMTKSYKLYCKEYKAPDGYVASTDVYPLTWSYDSYKALKDKGDETGELQTFGGDTGIFNTKDYWKLRYRIKKVGENGKALENAVFRIYDNENCSGTPVAEITTGKDGFTPVQTVENIWTLTKSYKLYCKEYKAPEGYVVNTDVYPLTWSYDSYKTLKDKGNETGELQTFGGDTGIENERDVWKLRYRVKKVGEDGKVLENAVFRIYDNKDCSGTPVAELTTGKDGFTPVQTVENISVGTTSYKLYCKEYSAPEGYVATTLVYPLTFKYDSYKALKDKGDTSGELQTFGGDHGIINVKTGTGYAYVEKISKASKDILNLSGYSLAGAEFTITDGNGFNEVMTTDENGISNQIRLPEYYNEEPDGANEWDDTSDDTDTVALNDDNGIVTEDAESGISAQAYIPVTTEYTITETKAPKGHTINKKPLKIRVTMPADKNKVFKLEFADEPIFVKAGLNIRKLSAKGNAIEGVVFKTEYLDEDKVVRTWYLTSDKDGNVKLDRDHLSTAGYRNDAFFTYNNKIVLPIGGVLRMTEVSAPAQYKVDDTPFTFDLSSENATLTKTVYNDLEKGKLKVVKHGTDGKTLLEGVEFELKFVKESETATSDKQSDFKRLLNVGETVKATTDANGEITWENLDQGDYQITETKTVPGYTLLKDPINVTLPLQMTKSKADAYGNVNFNAAKEDKNYTKKWFFFEYSFDITNTLILHLPETGATGTWMYGFVGLGMAMAAGAAGMVVTKRRRRKKQDK